MQNRHRSPTLALLVLLAAATATACSDSQAATLGNPQGISGTGRADESLPQVVTTEVVNEDLTFSVTMPGSVRALESADLYAKVGGYLQRIEVDIGDEVEEGRLLAVISVPEMVPELRRHEAEVEYARSQVEQQVAAVNEAGAVVAATEAELTRLQAARREKEADLALRNSELERWQELIEDSPSIEKRKLDEARHQRDAAVAAVASVDADMLAARARIEEAKAAVLKAQADERVARARVPVAEASRDAMQELMQYAEIKAPFAGVITERHVHPGAFIRPASTNSGAMPLLRIERVDRVRVTVDLPMDAVASLSRGDRVVFDGLAASPETRFEGVITRLSGALGQRSRMMRAEVELDNPPDARRERRLRPGYYGDLAVFLEEYPDTPTVPATAVFARGGETCVFTVESGKVRRCSIEAVFRDGTKVGVGAGLSAGQVVVASGVGGLEDGQSVRVKPASSGGR